MLIYYLAFIILWSTPGFTTPPSSSTANSDELIDDTDFMVREISNLYLSNSFSDVDLLVDGEQLPAHRILLALRSEYFMKLFYGDQKTDEVAVIISAEPVALFKRLLKYIYTGQIALSALKGEEIFKLFDMANFLGVPYLQSECPSSSHADNDEQINHVNFLISDISSLYLNKSLSDVVLVVLGEQLHAHRFLLASYSKVLKALFYGGHKETNKEDVEIIDAPFNIFEILLRYMYKGQLDISLVEDREVFDLLKFSDFFDLSNLRIKLHNYLEKSIDLGNACSFLTTARFYQFEELEAKALNFIDNNSLQILQEKDFQNLSPDALQEILIRDTFYAEEETIFISVWRWIKKNQDDLDPDTQTDVLCYIRYPLMSDEERSKVIESQVVSSDIISCAMQYQARFRGQLKPNEHLGFQSHWPPAINMNRIHRSQRFSLFYNRFTTNVIKLNYPSFINFIDITLRNVNQRLYSYYIEVSPDGLEWERVIDYSNYNCRSHQHLWIQPQVVQYIHIVGTNSTADATFIIWGVIYYTEDIMSHFETKNGVVVPKGKYNVASRQKDAIVIKGENSVNGKSLLDEYEDDHARNNTYTYHLLGSTDSIVVHLTQPFILSSMRMLLWGGDNQTYSYTIEASVDGQEWVIIVDKSKELTQSWQLLKFEPIVIIYIRITGNHSSTGKDFRCVYLEAPAQVPLDSDDHEDSTTSETSDHTRLS